MRQIGSFQWNSLCVVIRQRRCFTLLGRRTRSEIKSKRIYRYFLFCVKQSQYLLICRTVFCSILSNVACTITSAQHRALDRTGSLTHTHKTLIENSCRHYSPGGELCRSAIFRIYRLQIQSGRVFFKRDTSQICFCFSVLMFTLPNCKESAHVTSTVFALRYEHGMRPKSTERFMPFHFNRKWNAVLPASGDILLLLRSSYLQQQ